MSNIIVQGNEINAKQYVEKITIEGIGEEKSLNPRMIVAKNNMIKYSTEEQVIGTWIDGKPLYQKSVTSNIDLTPNNTNPISTGITNAKEIIETIGMVAYGVDPGEYWLTLPFCDDPGSGITNSLVKIISVNKYNGIVGIYVGSNYRDSYTINKVILTIRYTKTTDYT